MSYKREQNGCEVHATLTFGHDNLAYLCLILTKCPQGIPEFYPDSYRIHKSGKDSLTTQCLQPQLLAQKKCHKDT